jgi:hypothetical protein
MTQIPKLGGWTAPAGSVAARPTFAINTIGVLELKARDRLPASGGGAVCIN